MGRMQITKQAGLMSNTSDRSPMEKSLLLVVPIDPMVKMFTVGEIFVSWGNIACVADARFHNSFL